MLEEVINKFLSSNKDDVNWIVKAAKQVANSSLTSHPSKFSHPEAKTTAIIANNSYNIDGYLRTGNVRHKLDEIDVMVDNGKNMRAYRFLLLQLPNGKNILENLDANDELLKAYFSKYSLNFEQVRSDFLLIKSAKLFNKTDNLVKQVYFPINSNSQEYHLLSLLTSSKILSELKRQIQGLSYSEDQQYKKDNKYPLTGYSKIYNLTKISFGGTQPQNISVLNKGHFSLLASVPPPLEIRNIKRPTRSFFKQCLYITKLFYDSFNQLHRLMKDKPNNDGTRKDILITIKSIVDQILLTAASIRSHYKAGWSLTDYYSNLPKDQQIWLDSIYQEDKELQHEWREEISMSIARWIINNYEEIMYKKSKKYFILADYELFKIHDIVMEVLNEDKENF